MNGELIKLIKLFRFIRQGCLFVFYLFVLVADLFILMVKTSKEIRGLILLSGAEFRVVAVVDDN